jgi:hypothetical protein
VYDLDHKAIYHNSIGVTIKISSDVPRMVKIISHTMLAAMLVSDALNPMLIRIPIDFLTGICLCAIIGA